MHRFYVLQGTRDLFGGWALLREWGRVGSPGRMRTMSYPDCAGRRSGHRRGGMM
jgi:predicted DNA-binding WGR domain protein